MIIIELLIFIIFLLLFIFPLGKFFLDSLRIRFSFWELILIATNVGIVILILAAFVSGFFNLGKFFYFLPIFTFIYFIKQKKLFKKNPLDSILKTRIDLKLLLTLFVAVTFSGYITFFSGDIVNGGFRSIGGNTHDGLWHIALINQILENIPPQNPIYSNTDIRNYHYLTDVFVAITSYVTGISVMSLYFKLIPAFFIVLLSGLIFLLIRKITGNTLFSYFGIIFVILSSNLFYLVRIFYPNAYFNPSVLWVDEFTTKMVNPQLLLSYIVILTIIYLILSFKKITDFKFIIFISFIGASLLGIKSYGFIIFSTSIVILGLFFLVKGNLSYLKISYWLIIVSTFFYLISNITREFLFIFSPFWFIKNIFETSDHLANSIWELKRQTFLEHKNYLRIIQLYLQGTIIFLIGNFGGKLIGFFTPFLKFDSRRKQIILLLELIGLVGFIFPMIFIQRGIAWNSVQFFYYTTFSLGLLTAITLAEIYKKYKYIGLVLASIIWITLLPGVFFIYSQYYPFKTKSWGLKDTLSASEFLKSRSDGVILLNPKYFSDSLVSAFSKKVVFFADETQLDIQLIDFKERKKANQDFFKNYTLSSKRNFLSQNRIKYIFTEKNNSLDLENINVKKIYENQSIIVYENFVN